MKFQIVTVMAIASVENVLALVVSKVVSVKKLTVKIQHVLIMAIVLKASASVRKVGLAKIVRLKIKPLFPVSQLAQTTESSTCTLKSAAVN